MNKDQAIESVSNSISSIFTKDDVLNILSKINYPTTEQLVDSIMGDVEVDEFVTIDTDDVSFNIENGDTITIDENSLELSIDIEAFKNQLVNSINREMHLKSFIMQDK